MLGELLGEWMRLTGSGTISLYRQKAIWLASTANVRLSQGQPGQWLRDLSDRGFLELDWENGRWSCNPVAITRLPAADGLAVLAGFACTRALDALAFINVDIHTADSTSTAEQTLARPAATFLQYGSVTNLREAASATDATYIPCSAWQLAENLLPVVLGSASAPPNTHNDTLAFFNADRLRWYSPVPGPLPSGLYRYEGNGRRNFLWHENSDWRHCEMSAGIWTALARTATNAIRWRPYPGVDPEVGTGTLFADVGASLPALHRRCLVLCSGLTPRYSAAANTLVHENVPRGIAEIVWLTLGQRPQILAKGDWHAV